jgi:hypothetical protein
VWIERRSAIGSEACGVPAREGSQRSRHSCRQMAGRRLEFQLLQPANFQGFIAFLSLGPTILRAGKPTQDPEGFQRPSGNIGANGSVRISSPDRSLGWIGQSLARPRPTSRESMSGPSANRLDLIPPSPPDQLGHALRLPTSDPPSTRSQPRSGSRQQVFRLPPCRTSPSIDQSACSAKHSA